MAKIKELQWFLRTHCNANPPCRYCYGPRRSHQAEGSLDQEIATTVVRHRIPDTTLTGGEPTTAKTLLPVLDILARGGVKTNLHTNGLTLSPRLLDSLKGMVESIALPIDAVDPQIQSFLRSPTFVDRVSSRILKLTDMVLARGINVAYHTVFTTQNVSEIPLIYRLIRRASFSRWRIFEFNPQSGALDPDLSFLGTWRCGHTDGLESEFYQMEQRIMESGDPRVTFVSCEDRPGEFFVDPCGQLTSYSYSQDRRHHLGHLRETNLPRLVSLSQDVALRSFEQHIGRPEDWPAWKLWADGAFGGEPEDWEGIDGRSVGKMYRLGELWIRRTCTQN